MQRVVQSSTYVTKTIQSEGVGEYLLDYVMKEAEKSALEYVIAFVSAKNEAVLKITQNTGWIEVGKIPPSKKGKTNFKKYL